MLLFAVAVSALLSMPGLNGDDEKVEVPSPAEVWSATVSDATLTDTTLSEVSFDGDTHLQGAYGAGVISIRFEEIVKVDFEPAEKGKVVALVNLKVGGVRKVIMDAKLPIYGKTGFGNFKVLVKDTRRIVFNGPPVKRYEMKASPHPSGT